MRGVVLYRGPSQIDGKRIICIATFKSKNVKTGNMVQTWILADNGERPVDNVKSGNDASICGDCPHRAQNGKLGSCYVNVGQAPGQIYNTFLQGKYDKYNPRKHSKYFAGKVVRVGSYGDPVAVPLQVWTDILSFAQNWTGYTHQWRKKEYQEYKRFCMASVETEYDSREAYLMGWRTFRVRMAGAPILSNEIVCPASIEAGQRRTCETCKACRGTGERGNSAKSVVIVVHGLAWKMAKYERKVNEIEVKQRFLMNLV